MNLGLSDGIAIQSDLFSFFPDRVGEAAEHQRAGVSDGALFYLAQPLKEAASRSDTDALRLYEEWMRTGSPRVGERLRGLGLLPTRGGGTA